MYNQILHHYNVDSLNPLDPELQLISTKLLIKNKLLSELKNCKVQRILALDYKKRNHSKIIHSSTNC